MGLIGSLLLTGLLAALVPKLRASMLHGIPAIASAVLTGSQSRRSHDAVKSALHTLAAIIYSIARILFATIIQIMDFMRPRILSAKRYVRQHIE